MIDQDEQILILGENYFLEHYGKKGMKWGVRRRVSGSAAQVGRITGKQIKNLKKNREDRIRLTKKEKKQLTVAALKTTGGVAVAAGAAYALHYMGNRGRTPIVKVKANKDFIDVGSRVVKTIFERNMIAAPAKMLTR